jgi:hypothetical protein
MHFGQGKASFFGIKSTAFNAEGWMAVCDLENAYRAWEHLILRRPGYIGDNCCG